MALRRYLLNGGFLMVDDFWGDYEWQNFYEQIKRVFPDREPEELPLDHEIFHCVYRLKEKPQVPSIHAWPGPGSNVTWEERHGGDTAHGPLQGDLRRQGPDDGDHLPQHRPRRRLGARGRRRRVLPRVLREEVLPDGDQHRHLCHDALMVPLRMVAC